MNSNLKPGDRVRLKDTICFGTVTEVNCAFDGEPLPGVVVEWDGCEGVPSPVDVTELDFVRPPPLGWDSCAEGSLRDR